MASASAKPALRHKNFNRFQNQPCSAFTLGGNHIIGFSSIDGITLQRKIHTRSFINAHYYALVHVSSPGLNKKSTKITTSTNSNANTIWQSDLLTFLYILQTKGILSTFAISLEKVFSSVYYADLNKNNANIVKRHWQRKNLFLTVLHEIGADIAKLPYSPSSLRPLHYSSSPLCVLYTLWIDMHNHL